MWNEIAAQHCWLKFYVIDQKAKIHIHAWWWPYCVGASKYLKSWELCAWSPREGKHHYVKKLFATSPERVCLVLRELLFSPIRINKYVVALGYCHSGSALRASQSSAVGRSHLASQSIYKWFILKKKKNAISPFSHITEVTQWLNNAWIKWVECWRAFTAASLHREYIIYERFSLINLWNILKVQSLYFSRDLRVL